MRRSGPLSAAVRVLRQTVCDVWAAQAMEWAAALACYGVLSLFPLLLAGAAVVSYVVAPAVVTARLSAKRAMERFGAGEQRPDKVRPGNAKHAEHPLHGEYAHFGCQEPVGTLMADAQKSTGSWMICMTHISDGCPLASGRRVVA